MDNKRITTILQVKFRETRLSKRTTKNFTTRLVSTTA